jgi:hypothetical protein
LRNRLLAAVIVTMAALGSVGVFLVPRVAARYMKSHDRPEQSWISTGIPPDYAGPVIEVIPSIEITTPVTIRVNNAKRISIAIEGKPMGHGEDLMPGSGGTISDQGPRIDNRVAASYTVDLKTSDDFGMACAEPKTRPMAALSTQTWYCSVRPKQPGDYEILVSGLPPAKDAGNTFAVYNVPEGGLDPMLRIFGMAKRDQTYERLPDGTVSLHVQVLTEQGFTSGQLGWLQAFGAVIGVFGTIFAFPFLKAWFDKTPPPTPVPVLPPAPPPVAPSEKTKDSERKKKAQDRKAK